MTASFRLRSDTLLAGHWEVNHSASTTPAERTCIRKAGLSNKQRALQTLRARLLAQAQREVSLTSFAALFEKLDPRMPCRKDLVLSRPKFRQLNERLVQVPIQVISFICQLLYITFVLRPRLKSTSKSKYINLSTFHGVCLYHVVLITIETDDSMQLFTIYGCPKLYESFDCT